MVSLTEIESHDVAPACDASGKQSINHAPRAQVSMLDCPVGPANQRNFHSDRFRVPLRKPEPDLCLATEETRTRLFIQE